MDAVTLGAVGSIVVGLAVAAAAVYGHRGQQRTSYTGAVMTGYGGLVDQLQEERDKLRVQLAETETRLSAAYAELAGERADRATLQAQIATLTTEKQQLREQLAALGGDAQ